MVRRRTHRTLLVAGLTFIGLGLWVPGNLQAAVPTAPTINSYQQGNGWIEVSFTGAGNSPTAYQYSLDGGSTWADTAYVKTTSPLFIGGLTNGLAYDVAIRGVNGNGSGASSATISATPAPVSALSNSHAYLQGEYVEVGVRPNGAFGSTSNPPAGFHSTTGSCLGFRVDRQENGWGPVAGSSSPFDNIDDGDYFCPGSPYEGWALRVGGNVGFNADGVQTDIAGALSNLVSATSSAGAQSVQWDATSDFHGVSVSAVYSVPNQGQALETTVTLTNTTGADITDIYFGRGFDPDNSTGSSSGLTTSSSNNSIVLEGGPTTSAASVKAEFASGAVVFISSPTSSARAAIHQSNCCSASEADPLKVFDRTSPWSTSSTTGDRQINVTVNIPLLAAGASVTFDIDYLLTQAAADNAGASGTTTTTSTTTTTVALPPPVFVPAPTTTPVTSTPSPTTTTRPTIPDGSTPAVPVTQVPDSLPSVAPGESQATLNGESIPVVVEQVDDAVWRMTGDGFEWQLEAEAPDGRRVPSGGVITLFENSSAQVSGSGFKPGSLVDIWLFSTPTFLGTVEVGDNGSFLGAVPIPSSIEAGNHTLQANGVTSDDAVRSLNLGVQVLESTLTLPITGPASDSQTWLAALLVLVGAAMLIVALRGRRAI